MHKGKLSAVFLFIIGAVLPCHATDFFTENFGSFDLEGLSLTFTPDGSTNYYSANAVPIHALPHDPESDYSVGVIGDDSYVQLRFAEEKSFSIYGGVNYGINIGSNGYITFNEFDRTYSSSMSNHFSTARISALYRDLNPATGGEILWNQFRDRFVVTFLDVPNYGSSTNNLNTFQTELFFNGKIRMSWMEVSGNYGIVGLSSGDQTSLDSFGIPLGYTETDLSEFAWDRDEDEMADKWELQYFNHITNCIVSADTDHDGYDNMAEYICGSHPRDPSSFFTISSEAATTGTGTIVVGWNAIEGRKYRLLRTENLHLAFQPVLEFDYPQSAYTGSVSSVGNQYLYKVEVEIAE